MNGYLEAMQELMTLKRFKEAENLINTGLKKYPNQMNMLIAATDIYRALGDWKKSLELSIILFKNYPENWNSYVKL